MQVLVQVAVPSAVPLPPGWAVSFDARGPLVVRAGSTRLLALDGEGAWRHVERTGASSAGSTLRFEGGGSVRALIISAVADRGALLLHRLAELHARIPLGAFPVGADVADRIHYGPRYWTSGFWAGALWQAAAVSSLFARWALPATVAHFGQERSDTHDVGFMYGESSLAAWRALCLRRDPPAVCPALRRSALAAAGELVTLARANGRAGTIPTSARSHDTIIDSMMNVALLLPWASSVTGNPVYARVASEHAQRVAALLVRPDGSTAQSVNFEPGPYISTHQGLSAHSTWSRGQGWAVYGFAVTAAELHDRSLLRVAERTAAYVAGHLPVGGVPRWDYDAPAGAPVDVSAGVITAAGLFHLAQACGTLGGCAGARWAGLGRRMLAAALTHASPAPPLGLLRDQVLNERGRGCWCDGGELSFGLTYALEAEGLSRSA